MLCLTSLLLLLGLTFLEFLEADYRFAAEQDRRQQAFYLAQAGLEFQRCRTDLLHPDAAGNMTQRRYLPAGATDTYFEVTVEPNGRVRSRGVVRNAFRILVEYQLVVEPGGSRPEAHAAPP